MNPETQQPGEAGAARGADVYDLLAWFEVNKKKVGIVAIVLVVAGFGVATVRYLNEKKENEASAALLGLKATLVPQTNATPVQPSAFLKVAEDYRGTAAANRALILAATALFTEGKYAEAEQQFTRFVQDHSGSPWAADAAYGQAAAMEAQNKTNEALAKYQAVATQYPNTGVAEQAKLAIARMHEQRNEPEQALRIYNELTPAAGARAGGSAEATRRKQALLKQHPQLNTNNIAPAPALIAPTVQTNAASANSSTPAATTTPAPAGTNAPAN